ncbi:MAG: hypothetical protein V3R57_06365 [Candidatus Bathyarchaeia archaeon]
MIGALYVDERGPYSRVAGLDIWGVSKDARLYKGPFKVIAHPPCKRWGRYWSGGPSAKQKRILGDDGGCFAQALWAVRSFGGILEHPEASHAWAWFSLQRPPRAGGWVSADIYGGMTCCVEQGHYGHRARKATWLYANKVSTPELIWGPSEGERLDEGFHSKDERDRARAMGQKPIKRLSAKENLWTPELFRDLLISIVKQSSRQ